MLALHKRATRRTQPLPPIFAFLNVTKDRDEFREYVEEEEIRFDEDRKGWKEVRETFGFQEKSAFADPWDLENKRRPVEERKKNSKTEKQHYSKTIAVLRNSLSAKEQKLKQQVEKCTNSNETVQLKAQIGDLRALLEIERRKSALVTKLRQSHNRTVMEMNSKLRKVEAEKGNLRLELYSRTSELSKMKQVVEQDREEYQGLVEKLREECIASEYVVSEMKIRHDREYDHLRKTLLAESDKMLKKEIANMKAKLSKEKELEVNRIKSIYEKQLQEYSAKEKNAAVQMQKLNVLKSEKNRGNEKVLSTKVAQLESEKNGLKRALGALKKYVAMSSKKEGEIEKLESWLEETRDELLEEKNKLIARMQDEMEAMVETQLKNEERIARLEKDIIDARKTQKHGDGSQEGESEEEKTPTADSDVLVLQEKVKQLELQLQNQSAKHEKEKEEMKMAMDLQMEQMKLKHEEDINQIHAAAEREIEFVEVAALEMKDEQVAEIEAYCRTLQDENEWFRRRLNTKEEEKELKKPISPVHSVEQTVMEENDSSHGSDHDAAWSADFQEEVTETSGLKGTDYINTSITDCYDETLTYDSGDLTIHTSFDPNKILEPMRFGISIVSPVDGVSKNSCGG